MESYIIGIAAIAAILWWSDSWPFDGSYNLRRRQAGSHDRAEPSPSPAKPPYG